MILDRVETQESLFSGQNAISRLVELGPSKTLVGMSQKTIKRKIELFERPHDQDIQFLASTHDTEVLCYEYAPPIEPQEVIEEQTCSSVNDILLSQSTDNDLPVPDVTLAAVINADIPPSTEDIIRTLIARKLQKPISDILHTKSIKELCGGTSFLCTNYMALLCS